MTDNRISEVYSGSYNAEKSHNHLGQVLQFEFGPQFFRYVELDLGVGLLRKSDFTQDAEGNESTQGTTLSWIPLSIGLTGRVHIVDEQVVVPHLSYGRDWVVWSENMDDGEGNKSGISGVKYGWHWAAGVSVLLDVFEFSRAASRGFNGYQ